ncbi:MAG: ATPase [Clostridia bacterium]|nr:ATPase [Clostridia bacterium]
MIVPMKKVSLIIAGEKKAKALKELQRLGMLHIEITEGSGEKLNELRGQITLLEKALYIAVSKKKTEQKELNASDALAVAKEIISLDEERSALQGEQIALNTELERLKGWGDFDPGTVTALIEKDIDVSFYEMPKAEYNSLGESIKTVKLEQTKSSVKCLIIKSHAEGEDEIISSLSVYKLNLPHESTEKMRQRVSELQEKVESIEEKITDCAVYSQAMKNAVKVCEKDVEFETYATGMEDETLSENGEKSISVAYFKGYIEAENLNKLKEAAKKNSWGLVAEDPCAEDDVPTKLKNNKFVSLIYPLTDFLGAVPGYFEYDISGWFLAFILIFFGIIFGDGGYGLFICAVAGIPIIKNLISKKPVPPAFLLIGLFGLSTVLWGTLTCTWFGLSAEQIPQWLQKLSIPVISNVYEDKIWYPFWTEGQAGLTTAQNLQIFCFTLALVQLTIAHIKGFVRNKGSLKMLGDIGSVLQLFGIYYLVLSLVVNPEVFSFSVIIGGIPVGTVSLALIGAGFLLSFVFSNYEGSIVKSILSSLTNIVSVLLGVVNVFSDIVSYIRLWAVGLAGAAIAATVNELAGPLLGNFLFMIIAIVLLVFGHGLNMILNVLSVIVHGIRLNTLEFSSHLDMSWSGHKFNPFKEQID